MPTATKPKTKLTAYQFEVLRLIVRGNPEATDPWDYNLDMDQLVAIAPRQTTKDALQFVIRSLVANGMITKLPKVKRRNRLRVTYLPTEMGKSVAGDRPKPPAFLEPEAGSVEAVLEGFEPGLLDLPNLGALG
jgi:hypothetical protein